MKRLTIPFDKKTLISFSAGEKILLNGKMYTARDQAHKKLTSAIRRRKKLPFAVRGSVIYYCGPTRTPPGCVIGSCGPTTSSRMDAFTPLLLRAGLRAAIGKGARSEEVRKAIRKYGAVYFLTYAGCGAFLSGHVTSRRLVAFPELGPEAIWELTVKDFPAIVGIDAKGRSVYGKE